MTVYHVLFKNWNYLSSFVSWWKKTNANEMLNKSSRSSESLYLRRIDNLKCMLFWSESLLILIDEMFLPN